MYAVRHGKVVKAIVISPQLGFRSNHVGLLTRQHLCLKSSTGPCLDLRLGTA